LKRNQSKKERCGSNGKVPAHQVQGPEFKHQSEKKNSVSQYLPWKTKDSKLF
jgi:hypothetical protein